MQWHALAPLVAAVANVCICVPVVRQRGRQPIHVAFAWMTLAIAAWNLDVFSLYYFTDPLRAEWWSRVFRTGMCFAPVTVYHVALLQADPRRSRSLGLMAGYAAATLLALANLAGWLVSGVIPHTWGWYPRPTPLYAGITGLVLIYLGLTVERVWHVYRYPRSPRQHTQAKFWFLATVIQVPFVVTNLLPLYGLDVYPLGNLGNVLYVSILAYAIARHRLMEVDYVVRKLASFSLAAAIVLLPGGAAVWALHRAGGSTPMAASLAALALALVATVLIPLLQRALETRVQRALFPTRYDYQKRLRGLPAEIVRILDRRVLLERLATALDEILEVECAAVFARHDETGRWAAVPDHAEVALPSEVLAALEEVREPLLTPELGALSERAMAEFEARGWEVLLPLRVNGSLAALVVLGRNREFRLFTAEDMQLLATLAASAGVALENARLSAQLRRSERVLEQSSRLSSLGMLAAGIAHEIRNPLSAVKTFLDLLPERLDDRDFLTDFRAMSLSELKRVTDLITDLLALGKSTTTAHTAVDVAETLEPVVRLMESTARKRQIGVAFTRNGAMPMVYANPNQLKQIILNLILNAIDASAPGAEVTVALHTKGAEQVLIEVLDRGAGIAPEKLAHIFDPFYTTKETGTGLGLALVHQMVREHGGEITVESAVGHGTAFRITLPGASLRQTGT